MVVAHYDSTISRWLHWLLAFDLLGLSDQLLVTTESLTSVYILLVDVVMSNMSYMHADGESRIYIYKY